MPDNTSEPESFDLSASDISEAFEEANYSLDASPAPVTPPADEESAADPTPADPAFNPEGPGNLKAALKAEREQVKALKAQFDVTNSRLAAIEGERQQAQQAQQQAQQRQLMQQNLEMMDPADVPAYVEAVQRQQQQQLQAATQQQQAWARVKDSEEAARLSLPDYDAQIDKLTGLFGLQAVADWARQQPGSPAIAAYTKGQSIFTQADLDAAEARGRATALEAGQPRGLRKQPSAPRLANIPSAGTPTPANPGERYAKQLAKGGDVTGTIGDMFKQALGG